MGKIATKAAGNVFYEARSEAAKNNERLASREGASLETGIDRTRLARIELGSITPYPEEVLLMAEFYNNPELKNVFCREMCPLGRDLPKIELSDLDRITVKALATFRNIEEQKEKLLEIAADGVITDDEKPDFEKVIHAMDELAAVAFNMKAWAERNLE